MRELLGDVRMGCTKLRWGDLAPATPLLPPVEPEHPRADAHQIGSPAVAGVVCRESVRDEERAKEME